MPSYTYKARNRQGELLTATVEAENEKIVASSLRAMAYSVISIEKETVFESRISEFWQKIRGVPQYELIFFSRQLASLLKSGIPIITALASIAEQAKNRILRQTINDVSKDVQAGVSFSEALSRHPKVFSEIYCSTIKVGETAGMLDQVLDRLAQLSSREYEVKSSVRSAMTYPVILVCVAALVLGFLIVNIVPKFVVIFETYEARLPLPTRVLLWTSEFARRFWILACLAVAALVFWLKNYAKTEKGRYHLDYGLLRMPLFGDLYLKVVVSRLCRTLGVMIRSGVPILEALSVSAKTVRNTVIRRIIDSVRSAIIAGQPMTEPFKTSGIFPPTVLQMMALGEKSGKLDEMLVEVAAFYDQEVDYTIKGLTTALEPILLIIMGFMVAFVALSVLLPIFNLIKVFKR